MKSTSAQIRDAELLKIRRQQFKNLHGAYTSPGNYILMMVMAGEINAGRYTYGELTEWLTKKKKKQ